jgi:hypothetical protein
MGEAMTAPGESGTMTRRQALKGLIALVGGTVSVAELAPLAQAAMADTDASPQFLDADQFALLGRAVDLMIPETDTPGAYGVGVHRFIDMMLAEYAAADRRETMQQALCDVNAASVSRYGKNFVDISSGEQLDLLVTVDKDAFEDRGSSAAYRMLKSMILFGYYTSEIGASVELRFVPYPGTTQGCVPVDSFDRAPFRTL